MYGNPADNSHACVFETPEDRSSGGWKVENRRPHGEAGSSGAAAENSRYGNRHGHGGMMTAMFDAYPGAHVIFIGAVNCLRHKPFMDFGRRMQERTASLLCPGMGDFSTGRYLDQLAEAMNEISAETGTKEFNVIYGCQWVILSSDADLLRDRMQSEYGITVHFSDDSHLVNGDHA